MAAPSETPAYGRPTIAPSRDDSVDPKIIVIAVGAVGLALGAVILMMVVAFRSDEPARPGAGGSTGRPDNRVAGIGEPGIIDFSRVSASVAFGTARAMASDVPGVVRKEVRLSGDLGEPGTQGKLWIYLPAGSHQPGTLPCVLIGPAGTRMVHGMELGEADQAEHYPYAEQGFAVVAYEIDGSLPNEDPPDNVFRKAYLEFTAASAGVVNARVALQYATSQVPEVDPDRIFVAGHSSAGTIALLCAEHVDGLAGCVAYAPCSDLEGFLAELVDMVEEVLPNVRRYMKDSSPMNHLDRLRCPVMVFNAVDDQVVTISESSRFVAQAAAAGGNVTLRTAARGGHYDAMIDEGIREGIAWMNRRKAATTSVTGTGAAVPSEPKPPQPTPGFRPPSSPAAPPVTSPATPPVPPPAISSATTTTAPPGVIRAHVHLKIASYPASGDPQTIARNALRSVTWADPNSIRVDRTAGEVVIGVRVMMVSTNTAKALLERAGFEIGGASFIPVR
jgi:acetyl esterase/lipase